MSETFSKVEVITGVARRRRFTTEQKLLVVNETLQPGMSISYVARRHGLSPSHPASAFLRFLSAPEISHSIELLKVSRDHNQR
jgi:Transposase